MTHPCPCAGCDRPAPGNTTICGACAADVARALAAVPGLVADLDVTLSKQHTRQPTGTADVEDDPTPAVLRIGTLGYDPRASEAAYILRSALVGWVRALAEHLTPHPGPACPRCEHPSCAAVRYSRGPADTPGSMAVWLSASLTRLAAHPAADEAHAEITGAIQAAQRAVDRPADRQFAGRCPGCDAALYARPGAPTVQCRDCDADPVDIDAQWDAMLAQVLDRLATAAQAAHILTRLAAPLKADLVRQWAKRGRLLQRGHDGHGHPLYRVADVLDLLAEKLGREETARAKREARAARPSPAEAAA